MQVYKSFMKIVRKKLPSSIIYLVIFAIIAFAMTFTAKDTMASNFEAKHLDICIIDEDESLLSKSFVEYMDSLHNLYQIDYDKETLQDNIYYRFIHYAAVLPEGFEESFTQDNAQNSIETYKIPGSTNDIYINQQINTFFQTVRNYQAGGFTLEESIQNTMESLTAAPNISLQTFQDDTQNESVSQIMYFYQYLPYVFLAILISGLTPILMTFNKKDLSNRISSSALTLANKNIQLALGSISYSVVIWLSFMIIAAICFKGDLFTKSSLLGMLNSFVFLIVSTTFSLFLSSFQLSPNIIGMVSNVFSLGMSFLCGIFVPQNLLAPEILNISRFLPAYWYVRINNIIGGIEREAVTKELFLSHIGVQLLFAVSFFIATLVITKIKRERKIA